MSLEEHFIPPRLREFKPREGGGPERARLQAIARDLKDVIALNSGDPDLTAAPAAVDAAIEALRSGNTHYVHGGLPHLRAALARKIQVENGFTVDPDRQILMTNGSAEAASAIFHTILEPGDEVLTTDPAYGGHVAAVTAARGTPVFVPTRGDELWEPDPDEVERRITPRTRAFIFANPGNPSGAAYRRETLQTLVDIAHRKNILIIPDELFERYVYDGRKHISAASLPGAEDRVVTINGFSKSYCMTGWRLGWIASPKWLVEALDNVRYALSMVAGTQSQWGAAAALSEAARPYYDDVYRIYGERRAYFFDTLTQMGLPQRPAPGAFVGMIDIRPTGRTGMEVAETFLRDARVFIWPGTLFGSCAEGYLRVSLIQPLDVLRDMMRRLEPVVAALLAGAPSRR